MLRYTEQNVLPKVLLKSCLIITQRKKVQNFRFWPRSWTVLVPGFLCKLYNKMFRVFRENANLLKVVRILKKFIKNLQRSSKFFRKCFSYLNGLVMVTNEGLISLGGRGGWVVFALISRISFILIIYKY